MSMPSHQRASVPSVTIALLIPLFLCFPLAAEELRIRPHLSDDAFSKNLEIAALTPPAGDLAAKSAVGSKRRELRGKLDKLKDVLEELRFYGDVAQQIIHMAEEVRALRAANLDLEHAIAEETIIRNRLDQKRLETQAAVGRLAASVVANWLTLETLNQDIAKQDNRLIAIEADREASDAQLTHFQMQVIHHGHETGKLRAKSAALAAEVGRTKREIINVTRENRAIDIERQAIDAATQQLRHDIAARLRLMLSINQQRAE